jgi:hypothetical protein
LLQRATTKCSRCSSCHNIVRGHRITTFIANLQAAARPQSCERPLWGAQMSAATSAAGTRSLRALRRRNCCGSRHLSSPLARRPRCTAGRRREGGPSRPCGSGSDAAALRSNVIVGRAGLRWWEYVGNVAMPAFMSSHFLESSQEVLA